MTYWFGLLNRIPRDLQKQIRLFVPSRGDLSAPRGLLCVMFNTDSWSRRSVAAALTAAGILPYPCRRRNC